MKEIIINALEKELVLLGVFALFVIANIIIGVAINDDKFEFAKLWKGVKKALIVAFSIVALSIGVIVLPIISKDMGLTISGIEDISLPIIYGMLLTANAMWASKCIMSIRKVLNISKDDTVQPIALIGNTGVNSRTQTEDSKEENGVG